MQERVLEYKSFADIYDIKDTEKKLCKNYAKRREIFSKKWKNVLMNCFFS